MKNKLYLKVGLTCLVLIACVTTFVLYQVYSTNNRECMIPIVKLKEGASPTDPALTKGYVITADDIDYETRKYGTLGQYVITDVNELVGKYVVRDYYPYEEFTANSLAVDYPVKLSENIYYNGITLPTSLIKTNNGEVHENDFVKILIILGKEQDKDGNTTQAVDAMDLEGLMPESKSIIVESKYLAAVRVAGIYRADGANTYTKMVKGAAKDSPAMITFDLNPVQMALVEYAKHNGSIEMIIIPEQEQEYYRKLWRIDENGRIAKDIDKETVTNELANVTDTTNTEEIKSVIGVAEEVEDMTATQGKAIADQEIQSAISEQTQTAATTQIPTKSEQEARDNGMVDEPVK